MHRDFKTPQDVYNASPDRIERCLARVLRQGFESRPFLYRLKFRYQGGQSAPLLYIGTLGRAWHDYINENARANDLATGTCELQRGDTGRIRIRLDVKSGRGKRDANLALLNRSLRFLNAEIAFADTAKPAGDRTRAPSVNISAGSTKTIPDTQPPAPPDLNKEFKVIRDSFESFKSKPTPSALDELNSRIQRVQSDLESRPELMDSKGAKMVAQLKTLLAEKGAAFVAKQGT